MNFLIYLHEVCVPSNFKSDAVIFFEKKNLILEVSVKTALNGFKMSFSKFHNKSLREFCIKLQRHKVLN